MTKTPYQEFVSTDKLSTLLRLALDDVERVIERKDVRLNMAKFMYYRHEDKSFCVCMAGAFMLQSGRRHLKPQLIDFYGRHFFWKTENFRYRCLAVESLRRGLILKAQREMGVVERDVPGFFRNYKVPPKIRTWENREESLAFYRHMQHQLQSRGY